MSAQAASGHTQNDAALASCAAHWAAGDLPVPPIPPGVSGRIQSVVTLAPSDVWALAGGTVDGGGEKAFLYHYDGTGWDGPTSIAGPDAFYATSLAASSDSNVWLAGSSSADRPEVWHYDGTAWSDVSPSLSSYALLNSAVAGEDGSVYVGGTNDATDSGIIWRYDSSGWTDITPSNPAHQYNSLTMTGNGTLVAAGADVTPGYTPVLQELSAGAWSTISVPVASGVLAGVTAAHDGTVFAVGQGPGDLPILVEQHPGSSSASVISIPGPSARTAMTAEMGVVAVGPANVWMFGQYETDHGGYWPWITHFDGTRVATASTPEYQGPDWAIAGGSPVGAAVLAYGSEDKEANTPILKMLAVCPVQVGDTVIAPDAERSAIGDQVYWSTPVSDTTLHDLTSPGLFDSGTINPGGSFEFTFYAAATYSVNDKISGATSTVRVKPTVTPAIGVSGTVFSITTADIAAPVGYAYKILVKRPGSAGYVVLTTTTQPTISFVPDAGTGKYSFRAEVKTPYGTTARSPAVIVTVS